MIICPTIRARPIFKQEWSEHIVPPPRDLIRQAGKALEETIDERIAQPPHSALRAWQITLSGNTTGRLMTSDVVLKFEPMIVLQAC